MGKEYTQTRSWSARMAVSILLPVDTGTSPLVAEVARVADQQEPLISPALL